jgi:hypothetical protein
MKRLISLIFILIVSCSKYDLTRLANTVEGYASKPNYIVKSALDLELIWCPPGSFIMGDGVDAQQVILTKGFYLGKYEVTQEQYEKVMGNNPGKFKGENLPVEQVTWDDALAFCKALTRQESIPRGWEFTLPTEAQWEYACRAGTTTKYSWGDDLDPKLANYKDSGLKKTGAVGSYRPNAWGFYDMHGNVSEWCADRTRSRRTARSYYPLTDPIGGSSISKFNLRGGDWYTDGTEIRSAHWYITPPQYPLQQHRLPCWFPTAVVRELMYGRMTDMAEGEGGARRAWPKGAVAQKGHMPASGARGLIHEPPHPSLPLEWIPSARHVVGLLNC